MESAKVGQPVMVDVQEKGKITAVKDGVYTVLTESGRKVKVSIYGLHKLRELPEHVDEPWPGRYRARYKKKSLGIFATPEEAAAEYNRVTHLPSAGGVK